MKNVVLQTFSFRFHFHSKALLKLFIHFRYKVLCSVSHLFFSICGKRNAFKLINIKWKIVAKGVTVCEYACSVCHPSSVCEMCWGWQNKRTDTIFIFIFFGIRGHFLFGFSPCFFFFILFLFIIKGIKELFLWRCILLLQLFFFCTYICAVQHTLLFS